MSFFVAFYSYKGGVGRTLATANVAYALAARGKRVVLIDMDLEAPGLLSYPELSLTGATAKPGVVEYATAYAKAGDCPKLHRYVHAARRSPGTGALWIMPAGKLDQRYQENLARLDWRRLHPRKGSQPFVDRLKADLTALYQPDYVLIDARTGLSDVGGLSTHYFADMVVLVFNLTRASIEGSVRAYRSFEDAGVKMIQLVASPVPAVAPGGSRVDERLRQAEKLMPGAVRHGRRILSIDYDPGMVLGDELAVIAPRTYRAAAVYEELREIIQRTSPGEVFSVLEVVQAARSEGRLDDALALLEDFLLANPKNMEGHLELGKILMEAGRWSEAVKRFMRATELSPSLASGYRRLGEALLGSERAEEAIEALEKARELGEANRELHEARARAFSLLERPADELEARRQAIVATLDPSILRSKPPEIENVRSDFLAVLNSRPPFFGFKADGFWRLLMGSLLLSRRQKLQIARSVLKGDLPATEIQNLLRTLEEDRRTRIGTLGPAADSLHALVAEHDVDPTDASGLLDLLGRDSSADSALLLHAGLTLSDRKAAIPYLRQAVERDPRNANAHRWLADALSDREAEAEEEPRLIESLEHYRAATDLDHNFYEAFVNWGAALAKLATMRVEERQVLLVEACERYRAAVDIAPKRHQALYNWGNALCELAEISAKRERAGLLRDACQLYRQAVDSKPDAHEALNNWGAALREAALLSELTERNELLLEACSRFEGAVDAKPDNLGALSNWGATLNMLARLREGAAKNELLHEACRRFKAAAEADPKLFEVRNNWGIALRMLSESTVSGEKQHLLNEALRQYEMALEIEPKSSTVLTNVVTALLELSCMSDRASALELLNRAVAYCEQANHLTPHSADYNLACVLTRLGRTSEAAQLLAGDLVRQPSMRRHALNDRDLEPLFDSHPGLREAASTSLENGDDVSAIQQWRRSHALQVEPTH